MGTLTEVQIIKKDGKPAFAVIPYEEYLRLLPEEVDDSKIEAAIKNGVFTLKIPKVHKSKKKKIEVSLSE